MRLKFNWIYIRNICFMDFLETSLNNRNKIKDEKSKKLQDEFRQINDNNLVEYQKEESIASDETKDKYFLKVEKISFWAKKNKIQLSKDITLEEINSLVDKFLFPQIMNKLSSLKKERNVILQLLFPQLINNLFGSFELFNKIKNILFHDLKSEMSKSSNLLLKSNETEDALKSEINSGKIQLKKVETKFKNEKIEYEKKIKALEEEMRKLKEENLSKKIVTEDDYDTLLQKYQNVFELNNSLVIVNESYASDIKALNIENESLKEKLENLRVELDNERKERIQLKGELDNERKERIQLEGAVEEKIIKLEKDLKMIKEQREKNGKELIEFLINNNNEILKRVSAAFTLQEYK